MTGNAALQGGDGQLRSRQACRLRSNRGDRWPMMLQVWLLVICGALLSLAGVAEAADEPASSPHLQRPWETTCRHPLPPQGGFSPQEQWAWNQRLCLGRIADMSQVPGEDGRASGDSTDCRPGHEAALRRPAGSETGERGESRPMWPRSRTLSGKFLATILLHEPWRSAPPVSTLAIRCARFVDSVQLSYETVRSGLFFNDSIFEGDLDLYGTRFNAIVSLTGSTVRGQVRADSAVFDNRLFLRWGVDFHDEVRLVGVRVADNLEFSGSRLRKRLQADRLMVGGNLDMRPWEGPSSKEPVRTLFEGAVALPHATIAGEFNLPRTTFLDAVNFSNLQVAGDMTMNGTIMRKALTMQGARLGGSLRMGGEAQFDDEVFMLRLKAAGSVIFSQATVKGELSLESSAIEGSLFLRNMKLLREGNFILAAIGQSVDLSNGEFGGRLDFTQARIAAELRLNGADGRPPKWGAEASLILRNAVAGSLQSAMESWRPAAMPEGCDGARRSGRNGKPCLVPVDLAGFAYSRLAGLGGERGNTMVDAPARSLVAWLAADPHHELRANPQPYQQLAGVLRGAGMAEKAEEIQIAARDQRKDVACRRAANYLAFQADSGWSALFGGSVSNRLPRSSSAGEWFRGDVWDCGWSEVLRITVGYGFENGRIAIWLLVVVLIGFAVLLCCDEAKLAAAGLPDLPSLWWYSVDMALPIVQLQDKHKKIVLPHLPMFYFNCQKIAGFVLASLFVGSLAGLANT